MDSTAKVRFVVELSGKVINLCDVMPVAAANERAADERSLRTFFFVSCYANKRVPFFTCIEVRSTQVVGRIARTGRKEDLKKLKEVPRRVERARGFELTCD